MSPAPVPLPTSPAHDPLPTSPAPVPLIVSPLLLVDFGGKVIQAIASVSFLWLGSGTFWKLFMRQNPGVTGLRWECEWLPAVSAVGTETREAEGPLCEQWVDPMWGGPAWLGSPRPGSQENSRDNCAPPCSHFPYASSGPTGEGLWAANGVCPLRTACHRAFGAPLVSILYDQAWLHWDRKVGLA